MGYMPQVGGRRELPSPGAAETEISDVTQPIVEVGEPQVFKVKCRFN